MKRITLRRFHTWLPAGLLLLGIACGREEPVPPDPPAPAEPVATLTRPNETYQAKDLFYQTSFVSNSLALEPRSSDGMLMFSFSTSYSNTSFRHPAPILKNAVSSLAVSTGTVPAGTDRTAFHMELPMSIGASLPEEILDVESVTLSGVHILAFTLDPDFPFTKARIQEATITLPAWVEETYPFYIVDHKAPWRFGETVYPGQVNTWDIYSTVEHTLEAGEGIQGPDHRLVLDGTVIVDGILVVDENDRKNRDEAGSPWEGTFLFLWNPEAVEIRRLTGRVDLSREMEDCTLTFSRVPSFLNATGTVLDLEDLYGTVKVQNSSPAPVSVSGIIQSDEREYPFGERFGTAPLVAPREKEPYRGLLSEKGGRVPAGSENRYCDIPISGFSGAIDSNPVSFNVKDLRIQNDTDTPYQVEFDEDSWVSIQALISSPLLIGKDFQVVHSIPFTDVPASVSKLSRIKGSCTVENSFPFDYEIRPFFYDADWKEVPISTDPIRVAAGSQGSPTVASLTFDWKVESATARFMDLQLTGRTASGRQGEALYQDQYLALKDMIVEFY